MDGKKLITRGLKININIALLSYSIICAKLLFLSKMSSKYLVRHIPNSRPGQTVTHSAQNQLTCLNLTMQCWQKKSVSDSKQCWSKTEGRIVDLVINSWRCSKQVGQLIRFTGDNLKLICASAMVTMTVGMVQANVGQKVTFLTPP